MQFLKEKYVILRIHDPSEHGFQHSGYIYIVVDDVRKLELFGLLLYN